MFIQMIRRIDTKASLETDMAATMRRVSNNISSYRLLFYRTSFHKKTFIHDVKAT